MSVIGDNEAELEQQLEFSKVRRKLLEAQQRLETAYSL